MGKGSFVFYNSILESIEELGTDDVTLGEAMLAVLRYGIRGEEYEGDNPIIRCAMKQAIPLIDANKRKTHKGGAPEGNQNARKNKNNDSLFQNNDSLKKNNECTIIDGDGDVDYINNSVCIKDKDINKNINNIPIVPTMEKRQSATRFVKPTVEQVKEYINEKGYQVDAEAFVAYYESQGWRVGKNPMKNWKMAVVTWTKNFYGRGVSSKDLGRYHVDMSKDKFNEDIKKMNNG